MLQDAGTGYLASGEIFLKRVDKALTDLEITCEKDMSLNSARFLGKEEKQSVITIFISNIGLLSSFPSLPSSQLSSWTHFSSCSLLFFSFFFGKDYLYLSRQPGCRTHARARTRARVRETMLSLQPPKLFYRGKGWNALRHEVGKTWLVELRKGAYALSDGRPLILLGDGK